MSADGLIRIEAGLGLPHAFFGRTGGVSAGPYASLNAGLGSGDCPEAVRENRRRASEAVLPRGRLVTLRQVHSATVHVAGDWPEEARPEGDALVTDRPGLVLGVLTADCAPVLLADAAAGVVGAAHAGWRGALAGVLEATVAAMEGLGARRGRIRAAIGPAIGQASYEVGADLEAAFRAQAPGHARFFATGPDGRRYFDLAGFCRDRLLAAGLAEVETCEVDCCAEPSRFFSYRRARRTGARDYGRQLSAIALG